jgi:hypothetical protein
MATGRSMQLTRQIGEHLVAAELGRRGYVAAPFAGNVPMFDLLAADIRGYAIPIQVKAINGGWWQFSADEFLDVEIVGDRQTIKDTKVLLNPELLCVFVLLKQDRSDEFYIFRLQDLQGLIVNDYQAMLKRNNGLRSKNPQSLHCAIGPKHLEKFRDNWALVKSSFPVDDPSPAGVSTESKPLRRLQKRYA